jgi:hypothetical protein
MTTPLAQTRGAAGVARSSRLRGVRPDVAKRVT